MFKSFRAFRTTPAMQRISAPALSEALAKQPFHGIGATEKFTCGWVSPRPEPHSPLVEVVAGCWVMKLKIETKAVPSSAIKRELAARCAQLEKDRGAKVGRKEQKAMKEAIELELLPRAFIKTSALELWYDPKTMLLLVGSASAKASDSILQAFHLALEELSAELKGEVPLLTLQTEQAPASAMATWLQAKDAPDGFTLDRDLELKLPYDEKSVVRYTRHNLEIDEVVEHIKQGKLPTRIAMTWDNRVSFQLGDDTTIRKLELLDVVFESQTESGFDADWTLLSAELSKLVPALIGALGGELVRE